MPARYRGARRRRRDHRADKANLPPADLLGQVQFLTPDQIGGSRRGIQANWGPMVADA